MQADGYMRRHGPIPNRATDYLPLIFPQFGIDFPRSSIGLPGSVAFLDLYACNLPGNFTFDMLRTCRCHQVKFSISLPTSMRIEQVIS